MSKTGTWGDKTITLPDRKKDEGRQKAWCFHYKKSENYCTKKGGKCCGASHCDEYEYCKFRDKR